MIGHISIPGSISRMVTGQKWETDWPPQKLALQGVCVPCAQVPKAAKKCVKRTNIPGDQNSSLVGHG